MKKKINELEKNKEESLLQELAEVDNTTLSKLDYINELASQEAAWAAEWAPLEEKLLLKFKKIVEKENDFFRVRHIDKLNLAYDILIFLGKKNIGKSTEIYRMIGETIGNNKKFIYIRYSKNELDKAREMFNTDQFSPVQMIMEKGVWKFFPKEEIREALKNIGEDENRIVNSAFTRKYNIGFVGYAYEFCYCQSYTGSQYADFELVFYDECLTYDPRNTLKETHLNNWAAFLSSIARNKDNLKVFLFGNLQGTNNAILDFYGIKRDDKLRYIARGGDKGGCRVLFINGGSLYKGYESQTRAAKHAAGSYAAKLSGNEYLITTTLLIPPKLFDLLDHYVHFFYAEKLVTLKRIYMRGQWIWGIKVSKYEGYESFKDPIYTSDRLDFLKYSKLKYVGSISHYIDKLCYSVWYKKARFFDEASMEYCAELIKANPNKDDTFLETI